MNYVKITKRQLDTLKNLPNNLNDSTSNQCISGLLILGKLNQFKQVILDFHVSSLQEFFCKNKNSKITLYKHIKNEDPRNTRVLTFDIVNRINVNIEDKYNIVESINTPNIEQWIKCVIHSIYRKIFNHIVITSSDIIYAISIKKNYYYKILKLKLDNKWKLNDLFHYLLKEYLNIYEQQSKYCFIIPEIFNEYFNIVKAEKSDIIFYYNNFNENLARISI